MAKVSPVSIKYMVYANFEAEGALEKPDVIGALFGQTEGLLGTDLEMRELQKEGKIGRIEVDLENKDSKTTGVIKIPSALDKTETTLIAAAIETIERIGPSNAKIVIDKIEDVRENKRSFILERAKKLLEGIEEKMPKAREMSESVKLESRAGKIKEYGPEKLPCGEIDGKEIIIVEGRADVVNLLRNGVNNVIGMNGTILPESVKTLSFEKEEVTLFVDGDRGGQLIVKNVSDNAKIDFICIAPDGKEVEELQGKEILMALRKKMPASEFIKPKKEYRRRYEDEEKEERYTPAPVERKKFDRSLIEEKQDKLKEFMREVEDGRNAILLNDTLDVYKRVPIRSIYNVLSREAFSVMVIESVTMNVLKTAENFGIDTIIAKKFLASSEIVNLISI